MASQKFKTDVRIDAELNLNAQVANRALATDASKNVIATPVTSTELGYISGVTSSIQTQLNSKQASIGFTPENVTNKKTTLTDNSDTFYPTQKAV